MTDTGQNLYVNRSLYFFQLRRYLEYFDPARFLIVDHDALLDDRRATLAAVSRFLGVRDDFDSPAFDVLHHLSTQKRRNNLFGLWLQARLGNHVFRHLRVHQRHWFRLLACGAVSDPVPRPRVSREARKHLTAIFEPYVQRLQEFAGRRFDKWLTEEA